MKIKRSKYDKLWNYIKESNKEKYTLTFDEINNILDFKLDHSFLKYKKELELYGYKVSKISLKEKYVIFDKLS